MQEAGELQKAFLNELEAALDARAREGIVRRTLADALRVYSPENGNLASAFSTNRTIERLQIELHAIGEDASRKSETLRSQRLALLFLQRIP